MSGKWDKRGIPHKGWRCTFIVDLGGDRKPGEKIEYETCSMCGQEKIRYVHYMEHSDYPDTLRVGCICAAKMEGNYLAAKDRERVARNRASRRARWLSRKWRLSSKGNEYLNLNEGNIGVYRTKYGKWGFWINRKFYKEYYTRKDDAKMALFDEYDKIAY